MRLLLLAGCLLALTTLQLQAQTQRGAHLVGGQFQLDNLFREGNNLFTIGLSPNYGFFVARDLLIGARVDLQYIRSGDTDLLSFAGLPIVRYYIPGQNRVRFFIGAAVGGGVVSVEGDSAGLFEWDLGPGVDFFLNPHVALETTLFYEGIQREGGDYLSSIGFRVGFQIFIFKSGDE